MSSLRKNKSFLKDILLLALFLLGASCAHKKTEAPIAPPEPIVIKEDIEASTPSTSSDTLAPGEWQVYKGDASYRLGKPYKVNGVWYFPAENMKYDEIGYAAWYGDKFHNKLTANGEIFNKDALTAAHKTLPLPSVVRVTNINNGQSVIVRVNDRGPFVNDRLIDLSEKAAKALGMVNAGTLKVRVELLPAESQWVANQVRGKDNPTLPLALAVPPSTPFAPNETLNVEQNSPPMAAPIAPQNGGTTSLFDEAPIIDTNNSAVKTEELFPQDSPPEKAAPFPSAAYMIQVGSYSHHENAVKLNEKLGPIGPSSITPMDRNGVTLYKVQAGPFQEEAQADNALNQIRLLGIADAKIFKKES